MDNRRSPGYRRVEPDRLSNKRLILPIHIHVEASRVHLVLHEQRLVSHQIIDPQVASAAIATAATTDGTPLVAGRLGVKIDLP